MDRKYHLIINMKNYEWDISHSLFHTKTLKSGVSFAHLSLNHKSPLERDLHLNLTRCTLKRIYLYTQIISNILKLFQHQNRVIIFRT